MAKTQELNGNKILVWQDGSGMTMPEQAVLLHKDTLEDGLLFQLQQGDNWVCLNEDGAKELAKQINKAIRDRIYGF